jgi:hypothetical protein
MNFHQSNAMNFQSNTIRNFHQSKSNLKRLSFQPKLSPKPTEPKEFKGISKTEKISYPKPFHYNHPFQIRNLPKPFTIQSLEKQLPITFPQG